MAIYNYNEQSNSGGIYVIFNSHNWRIYVGSTQRFRTRWKDGHYGSLLKNKHQNKFLQADFNKCRELLGNDDFLEFHVIENMPSSTKEQRLLEEEKWIKVHYDKGQQCYNLCDRTISREGTKNKQGFSEEHRRKLSEAHKGKPNGRLGTHLSPETRLKMSLVAKGRGLGRELSPETRARIGAGGLGRHVSEETRRRISEKHKGKRLSAETKKRISENNGLRGKHMTTEHKKKISLANKGKEFSKEHRRRLSESKKKYKFTEEHLRNLRESQRKRRELVHQNALLAVDL